MLAEHLYACAEDGVRKSWAISTKPAQLSIELAFNIPVFATLLKRDYWLNGDTSHMEATDVVRHLAISRLRILDISEGGAHVDGVSADMGCHGRETDLTRYRIYRNSAVETTYISAHEGNKLRDPKEFPNLDIALAVLRQCGIPEYEIRRVTKELGAINGAIVQLPEPIVFS
jgi:hypothetical protein